MDDDVIPIIETFRRNADQAFGDDQTVWTHDVNGIALCEVTLDLFDTHAQQASAVVLESLQGALVDSERSIARDRKRDPRLSRGESLATWMKSRAEAGLLTEGFAESPLRPGGRNDRRHTRPRGHTRRRKFRRHAPAADPGLARSRDLHEFGIDRGHLFDQGRGGVESWIGRQEAVSVSEEYEVRRPDQIRHQRGEAIVVPESNLFVGHRIVLVDDRDHAERLE